MNTKGIVLPLILFAFATWIVWLVGLAGLQHYCDNGAAAATTNVFSFSSPPLGCQNLFRFYWFFFAFTFVTLLGLLICAVTKHAMGTALHYTRPFWIGMLAISTLLMMIASEGTLAALAYTTFLGWWRTAVAGAIMLVASLIFLMFAVGTHWDYDKDTGKEYVSTTRVVQGTTAAPVGVERV